MASHRLHTLVYMTVLLLILLAPEVAHAIGIAKVTIKVVDEQKNPIEKANVRIGFEVSGFKNTTYNMSEGLTKSDGLFSASALCNSHAGFTITKPGYYESDGKYDFITNSTNRWEPWNPEIMVVLRKVENPVPMYARDTNSSSSPFEIPVAGKDVGFDLILFDWLPPYGKGLVADFFCNLVIRDGEGPFDFGYNVNITFQRDFDGIQSVDEELMTGSEFKLPRFAPESGYEKSYRVIVDRNKTGSVSTSKENRSHFFRVRSEVENGKLKRALYGKIIGDIGFGRKKKTTAFLKFKYYLNPDYTRNLEFDPNRNLFLNLPSHEKLRFN